MKVDSSGIDKAALCQVLAAYGVEVERLAFIPRGDESYCYVAEAVDGARHFVKVLEGWPDKLATRYKIAHRLLAQCGHEYVVAPRATERGEFLSRLGTRAVAVFDYVDGSVLGPDEGVDNEWESIAAMMASLHSSADSFALSSLPREQFDVWLRDWLMRVLAAADDAAVPEGGYRRRAKDLISDHRDDVVATLEWLERLAKRAREIEWEPALTHGDFTPENLIRDEQGGLYLFDWCKLGVAPPERDLVNFVGERFESFLAIYMRNCARPPSLHLDLFAYYRCLLLLWAITDYGSWILLEEAPIEDKEAAWRALSRLFPIDYAGMQEEVRSLGEVIDRML
jgi:Ser/Thr protein kinase RdoA (MazF antagonist)